MKKILLLFSFLVANSILFAQQLPVTNQYYFNKFALSPCYAGFNTGIETYAGYRKEAAGFKGSPTDMSLNVNAPILKNSGIGLRLVSDKIDIFSNLFVDLAYAQHLKINDDLKLSLGLFAGIYDNSIDLTNVISDNTQTDNVLLNKQRHNGIALNSSFGFNINYKQKFNIGLSVPSIITSQNNYSDKNLNYKLQRQYQFFGTYEYSINPDISLVPIMLIKYMQNAPINYEVNTNVYYKRNNWAGISYKKGNIAGLNLGFLLSNRILLSYSYEIGFGGIIGETSGNHEVTVGFIFDKMKLDETARLALLEQKANEKALLQQIDSLKKVTGDFESELRKTKTVSAKDDDHFSELIGYQKDINQSQSNVQNEQGTTNGHKVLGHDTINQSEYFIDNDNLNENRKNITIDGEEKVNVIYENKILEVVKMDTQLVYSLKQKIEELEKELEEYKLSQTNNQNPQSVEQPALVGEGQNISVDYSPKIEAEKYPSLKDSIEEESRILESYNQVDNTTNTEMGQQNVDNTASTYDKALYSSTGYYIVIGAFEIKENAEDYMAYWRERNIDTYIEKTQEKKWHYVYLYKSNYLKEVVEKRHELYKQGFNEMWILILK